MLIEWIKYRFVNWSTKIKFRKTLLLTGRPFRGWLKVNWIFFKNYCKIFSIRKMKSNSINWNFLKVRTALKSLKITMNSLLNMIFLVLIAPLPLRWYRKIISDWFWRSASAINTLIGLWILLKIDYFSGMSSA